MGKLFLAYSRLFRLSGLAGLSMAPIFGALSLVDIGVEISYFSIFLLLILGLLKSIFGFVQNDIFDFNIDKLSRDLSERPLVTGVISIRTAYVICIISVALTFLICFVFFYRSNLSFYIALLCIIIAAISGSIYNIWGKKFALSPFIAAFADALYVLVGAYLVSPDGVISIFTWVIFILVYNQFLFMTIVPGGIKDADHDYKLNVKNIAIAAGVKVTKGKQVIIPLSFKLFGISIRLISSVIAFLPFIYYNYSFATWKIALLALIVLVVLYLSFKLVNIKTLSDKKVITKYFAIQGVLRYSFVPIILLPLIGVYYTLGLIFFPLIWFFIFSAISGKDIAPNL